MQEREANAKESTAYAAARLARTLRTYVELERAFGADVCPRRRPTSREAKAEALARLQAELLANGGCRRCLLHQGRRHIVFGEGNPDAELMFVGEAPGQDEDIQGRPFVGRAGQLLTRIIEAMGFKREDVYIGNIIKCRPPNNRTPTLEEIASCGPYILKQIAIIKPKIVVALGAVAARALLNTDHSVTNLRGIFLDFEGGKLLATYHPAYLLRNPAAKREVWEDMKKVRDALLKDDLPRAFSGRTGGAGQVKKETVRPARQLSVFPTESAPQEQ